MSIADLEEDPPGAHDTNLARLAIATVRGGAVLQSSGNVSHVFLAMSAALAAFGLINAAVVAGGT